MDFIPRAQVSVLKARLGAVPAKVSPSLPPPPPQEPEVFDLKPVVVPIAAENSILLRRIQSLEERIEAVEREVQRLRPPISEPISPAEPAEPISPAEPNSDLEPISPAEPNSDLEPNSDSVSAADVTADVLSNLEAMTRGELLIMASKLNISTSGIANKNKKLINAIRTELLKC